MKERIHSVDRSLGIFNFEQGKLKKFDSVDDWLIVLFDAHVFWLRLERFPE